MNEFFMNDLVDDLLEIGFDLKQVKAALEAKQPGGRFLTPTEVANAAIAFIDQPNTTGQAEILKGE